MKRGLLRDWTLAIAKVHREHKCRRCGCTGKLDAAHTIGREYDRAADGTRNGVLVVNPDDVVPLCVACHTAYDAHQVDLLPFLTQAEQARAVLHVGLMSALARLTGTRDWTQTQAA